MTEHKKIENLLRTAKFKSNQEINRDVLQDLLERLDRDNIRVSKKPGLGRYIMRSKFSKLVATAVVIIFIYSGINYFSDSKNGVVLGAVVEAMQKMSWIHAKATIQQSGQTIYHEVWECFNPKLNIDIESNGRIIYRNYVEGTLNIYEPSSNTLIINSVTDRFAQTKPESPTEIVQFMIEECESQGGHVTRKSSKMDDIPVEIFNLVSEYQDVKLVVDSERNLPISIETIAHVPEANLNAKSSVLLDYPEQGPEDIYSLGVPKDAQIIDNRPHGNTQNLINEIQKRFDEGFGNYLAIVLDSYVEDSNTLEPKKIIVMRQNDKQKRLDEYNVYNYTGSKSNIPTLYSIVKDTWPELTIQDALDLENDKYAEYQLIYDGNTSFYRRANYSGEDYTDSLNQDMFQMNGIESLMNLAWCNPSGLMVTSIEYHIKPEIIPEDSNHIGLVGLRLIKTVNTAIQRLPVRTIKESSSVYWFDPKKDYLLIEKVIEEKRNEGISQTVQKTIETAQTESGKWYPKVIVIESSSPGADGKINHTAIEQRIIVETNPVFKEGIFENIKISK